MKEYHVKQFVSYNLFSSIKINSKDIIYYLLLFAPGNVHKLQTNEDIEGEEGGTTLTEQSLAARV